MNICHALHTLQKMYTTEAECGTIKKMDRVRPNSASSKPNNIRSRSLPRYCIDSSLLSLSAMIVIAGITRPVCLAPRWSWTGLERGMTTGRTVCMSPSPSLSSLITLSSTPLPRSSPVYTSSSQDLTMIFKFWRVSSTTFCMTFLFPHQVAQSGFGVSAVKPSSAYPRNPMSCLCSTILYWISLIFSVLKML